MAFNIVYDEYVVKEDIPPLSADLRKRIKRAIEQKLVSHPEIYGKPLQHSLKGRRGLRVGDYRIIFKIRNNDVIISAIGHRSIIYKELNKRYKIHE